MIFILLSNGYLVRTREWRSDDPTWTNFGIHSWPHKPTDRINQAINSPERREAFQKELELHKNDGQARYGKSRETNEEVEALFEQVET